MMKFKIKQAVDGQFYFTLVARNGRVLMTSETYTRKWSCKKTIQVMKLLMNSRTKIVDETK